VAISVILPTLRADRARRCINRIAATSAGVDYEVVVVSPLDMPALLKGCRGYERVRFVQEPAKEGSCQANTLGYQQARGKYVFAIADDHLLAEGCLKSLVEFMRPHDDELFLAGARCYGLTGPGEEHTVYGLYYAYTPCIRRDRIEAIGGFYDPYYRCYWGDPDLAMRVWHHEGKAELCHDAWVEYHNAEDRLDSESHARYGERDYQAFVQRWHDRYGARVPSPKFRDINVRNPFVEPGLPPEMCTRLLVDLRRMDWPELRRELEEAPECFVTRQYIPETFTFAMEQSRDLSPDLRAKLADWFSLQVAGRPAASPVTDPAGPTEEACRLFASVAMFLLTAPLTQDAPQLVAEGMQRYNLIRYAGQYYAWPQEFGGFDPERCRTVGVSVPCEPLAWQLVKCLNESSPTANGPDWRKLRAVEEAILTDQPVDDNAGADHIEDVPPAIRDELAAWFTWALCRRPLAGSGAGRGLRRIGSSLVSIGSRSLKRVLGERRWGRVRRRLGRLRDRLRLKGACRP